MPVVADVDVRRLSSSRCVSCDVPGRREKVLCSLSPWLWTSASNTTEGVRYIWTPTWALVASRMSSSCSRIPPPARCCVASSLLIQRPDPSTPPADLQPSGRGRRRRAPPRPCGPACRWPPGHRQRPPQSVPAGAGSARQNSSVRVARGFHMLRAGNSRAADKVVGPGEAEAAGPVQRSERAQLQPDDIVRRRRGCPRATVGQDRIRYVDCGLPEADGTGYDGASDTGPSQATQRADGLIRRLCAPVADDFERLMGNTRGLAVVPRPFGKHARPAAAAQRRDGDVLPGLGIAREALCIQSAAAAGDPVTARGAANGKTWVRLLWSCRTGLVQRP